MRRMRLCYFRNAARDLISETRNQMCEFGRIIIVSAFIKMLFICTWCYLERDTISITSIRTVPSHIEVSLPLLDLIGFVTGMYRGWSLVWRNG
jgi:hypothetical protein